MSPRIYRLPLLPTLGAIRQRYPYQHGRLIRLHRLSWPLNSICPHGRRVMLVEELLHGVEGPLPVVLAPQDVRVIPADR